MKLFVCLSVALLTVSQASPMDDYLARQLWGEPSAQSSAASSPAYSGACGCGGRATADSSRKPDSSGSQVGQLNVPRFPHDLHQEKR